MSDVVFKAGDGAIRLVIDTSGMTDAQAKAAVQRAGQTLGPIMGASLGSAMMGPWGAALAAAGTAAGFGAYGVKQWMALESAQVDLAAALGIEVPPAIAPVDARNGGILVKDAHAPRR